MSFIPCFIPTLHPEGEVRIHNNTINSLSAVEYDAEYRYFCKDHLGSVRKVLSYDDDWSARWGGYTEYQSNLYAPFGQMEFEDNLAENKRLFTGKELQDSRVGNDILRQYDFGARYYDPTVARWTSMDPLAEMYYSRSPYNYALNNPINLFDPNGLYVQDPDRTYGPYDIPKPAEVIGQRPNRPNPWRYDGLNGLSTIGSYKNGDNTGAVAIPRDQLKNLDPGGGWEVTSELTSAGLAATEVSGVYVIYFSNSGAGSFKLVDYAKLGKIGGVGLYGLSIYTNTRDALTGKITNSEAGFNITIGGIAVINPIFAIPYGLTDALYPGGFGQGLKDVGQFKTERWESMPWWLKGHTLDVKTYQ